MSVLLRTPATGLDIEATSRTAQFMSHYGALFMEELEGTLHGVTCNDAANMACLLYSSAMAFDVQRQAVLTYTKPEAERCMSGLTA